MTMTLPGPDMSEREKQDRKRDAFMALYAEWLRLRAEDNDPSRPGDNELDFARGDRIAELARLICTTPAVFRWMVMLKVEVLELELGKYGTMATDSREVTMLGGIKADLVSYGMHSEP